MTHVTGYQHSVPLGLKYSHGTFWLHEGYDHVIRKGKFGNVIWYVLMNPVKAGIVKHWRDHKYTYLNPELKGFD